MANTHKFDESLRVRIERNLERFDARRIESCGRIRAAVAFTLTDCAKPAGIANIPHSFTQSGQAAFILTTRASQLKRHAGQRAFPGGRVDPGETPAEAALRELAEEIDLKLGAERILGRLDDYATRSGYVITPFVVWGESAAPLVPNPGEVDRIHRVPLGELLRADAPLLDTSDDGQHPVLRMPLGDSWFAAPSAAIAYQFREVALLGRPTRVAHFDQPRFAWK